MLCIRMRIELKDIDVGMNIVLIYRLRIAIVASKPFLTFLQTSKQRKP